MNSIIDLDLQGTIVEIKRTFTSLRSTSKEASSCKDEVKTPIAEAHQNPVDNSWQKIRQN